jgi:hypothetical protein
MLKNHTNCELVSISELKPHPHNPNTHSPEQIERLSKILNFQGWRFPIKVSKLSGFITSGHGRLDAAKLLGETHVPVSFQEYENQDQEKADLVSDNSIAAWSELDFSSINSMLADFDPSFEIDLLGIKNFTVDAVDKIIDDFEEPAPKDGPSTRESELIKCPNCGVMVSNG